MIKSFTLFILICALALGCYANPLSLSVVSASAVAVKASIPDEDGVLVERCALVNITVDIENGEGLLLSHLRTQSAHFYLPELEQIWEGKGCTQSDTVRKVLFYAVSPEDDLPPARIRRTFSFLLFYNGGTIPKFRLRLSVPNIKPEVDGISDVFSVDFKKQPNQALQHNDPSCHVSCFRTPRASRGRG
jgi:hypothetical protein